MEISDLKELRKAVKSKDTVADWIYGIYVDSENNAIWENVEKLIAMDESEQFRYHSILAKSLSTKLGRDSFPVNIRTQNEELLALRSSPGRSVAEFEDFKTGLLEGFAHTDPYYATLTRIIYDVPMRSSDKRRLEDGDVVYEALLFSISPAKLSQASLGLDADRVTELGRRWQIGNPKSGFLYPAFDNRAEDRNEVLLYSSSPDEEDFINDLFGIKPDEAPAGVKEQKEVFTELLGQMDVSVENAAAITENIVEKASEEDAPKTLEKETFRRILNAAGVNSDAFDEIYDASVGNKEIAMSAIADPYVTVRTDAAMIRLPSSKSQLIEARRIDGRDFLLIPADGTVTVNGVPVSAVGSAAAEGSDTDTQAENENFSRDAAGDFSADAPDAQLSGASGDDIPF